MGALALGQLTNLFSDWPILEYFNYTQARNGGPIALMMKDNILLAQGGKNKIFIFDAYGKLYKIIDVSLSRYPWPILMYVLLFIALICVQPHHRRNHWVGQVAPPGLQLRGGSLPDDERWTTLHHWYHPREVQGQSDFLRLCSTRW